MKAVFSAAFYLCVLSILPLAHLHCYTAFVGTRLSLSRAAKDELAVHCFAFRLRCSLTTPTRLEYGAQASGCSSLQFRQASQTDGTGKKRGGRPARVERDIKSRSQRSRGAVLSLRLQEPELLDPS